MSTIQEIFLTRSDPGNIGFSSVGGQICPLPSDSEEGLHILIGPGRKRVKTPIAPGLICSLDIASHEIFGRGTEIPISISPSIIALDGEREINISKDQHVSVRINNNGPVVIDIDLVLKWACEHSLFVYDQENIRSRQ